MFLACFVPLNSKTKMAKYRNQTQTHTNTHVHINAHTNILPATSPPAPKMPENFAVLSNWFVTKGNLCIIISIFTAGVRFKPYVSGTSVRMRHPRVL